jgi:hypothetical protein
VKIGFVDDLAAGDAIAGLRTDPGFPERYSEWHHFNLNDPAHDVYGIVNLALSGDVRSPELGRAGVSLVVWEGGRWHGTMNIHSTEEASFSAGSVHLAIGGTSVRLGDGGYEVSGALKDGSIALEATWRPRSFGVRIENIGGMVSSFIVPSLAVEGTLLVEDRRYDVRRATGYHDHNWGYWSWGRDMGWDWGYMIEVPTGRAGRVPPRSIVFGQVTDATRAEAKSDMVLMVWSGRRCAHVFLDEAVTMAVEGHLSDVDIPRVPGLMALLEPERPLVPQRVVIEAREGVDWIEIQLRVGQAMSFVIPHPQGPDITTVSELIGCYDVRGSLDGEEFRFSYMGFAELAG